RTYHMAVSAYTAEGTESALSAELPLGRVDQCVLDECDAMRRCRFGFVPNGTWCTIEGEHDPCAAVASCVSGTCVARANGDSKLESARLRVTVRQQEGRLTMHARFPSAGDFDPTATGATLD